MAQKIAGKAYIELVWKVDKLEWTIKTEISKIGKKSWQNFSQGFSSALWPLKSAILGAVSVAATWRLGKEIFTLASQVQQAKIAFDKLTKSEKKSIKLLEDIKTFAVNTPFDQMGLIDWAKKLMVYWFQAEQIIPIMNSLGNAVAAAGGGQDVMNGVIVALGQMQTKGKVVTQELRQMAERGIPVFDILKEKLNLTSEQVMEIGEQGISAAEAIPALLEWINERFGGVMEEQAKTIQGRFSNLVDIAKITLADIGLSVSDTAWGAITSVADMLTENKDDIVEFATNILDATTELWSAIMDVIWEVAEWWELLFEALWELMNDSWDENADLTTWIRGDWTDLGYYIKNWITAIVWAIRIVVVAVSWYIWGLFSFMQNWGDAVAWTFIMTFVWMFRVIGSFFSTFANNVINWFKIMINWLAKWVNWLWKQLNKVLPDSMEVWQVSLFEISNVKARGDIWKGEFDDAKKYWKQLTEVWEDSFWDANRAIKTERDSLLNGLLNNYEKRLDQNQRKRIKKEKNTVNTSLDWLFWWSSTTTSWAWWWIRQALKEEKELQKEVIKNYQDIGKAMDKNKSKIEKYKDKVAEIGDKFEEMKKKAKETFMEIGNSIKDLDKEQNLSLMWRYTELKEEKEKMERDSSFERTAKNINKNTLKSLKKSGSEEYWGQKIDELLKYKEIQEELSFIISKTTEEQRKQAEAVDKLSESERKYNEYLEKKAILLERQNIANAFASMEGLDIREAKDMKVIAWINEKTWELQASYWDEEKEKYIEITDFKNMQYAQDLVNKQMALMQEKEELENKITEEKIAYEWLQNKKMAMEAQYTIFLQWEIKKQVKFVDGLIAKYREAARARRSAMSWWTWWRAFGGAVKAGIPYIVGENFKPELFIPSTSGTIQPVNNYNQSRNINVDIGNVVADNPIDFADMMRDNLQNYL